MLLNADIVQSRYHVVVVVVVVVVFAVAVVVGIVVDYYYYYYYCYYLVGYCGCCWLFYNVYPLNTNLAQHLKKSVCMFVCVCVCVGMF